MLRSANEARETPETKSTGNSVRLRPSVLPSVPPVRAVWSLLDGIRRVLERSCGLLVP